MNTNICIFGDSIAWGKLDSEKGGWADRVKLAFQKQMPETFTKVYNLGIPGKTTSNLVERFEIECRTRDCDIAIIAMGINDSAYIGNEDNHLTSEKLFKENLEQIYTISQKLHVRHLVFVGLTPVNEVFTTPLLASTTGKTFKNSCVKKYDGYIQGFCNGHGLEYINLEGLIELNELPDGLHPTSSGHAKIADVVCNNIVTLF